MKRAIIIISTLLLSSEAFGFVLLSNRKRTLPASPENPTVQFFWDGKAPTIEDKGKYKGGRFADLPDGEFMAQLLQDSLDLWNNVPGSFLEMQIATDSSAVVDEEDKQNSIVIESNDNLSTAAYAKPYFEGDSEEIEDCDISISDRATPAKELAFTLAHELGHCVGLGHAHTNYGAIMGYSRTSRNLSLGADDMAGIIFLYPDPAFDTDEPRELIACGSVGTGEKQDETKASLALALLLLFPAAIAWVRRFLDRKFLD